MNRRELERSWKITMAHLETAKRQLPPNNQSVNEAIIRYEDWISHNELELALGELTDIGEDLDLAKAYWSELLAASENMSLPTHVALCRTYVDRFR